MNLRQAFVRCQGYAQGLEKICEDIMYYQQRITELQSNENKCIDKKNGARKFFLWVTIPFALFLGMFIAATELEDLVFLLTEPSFAIIIWAIIAAIVISCICWRRAAQKLRKMQVDHPVKLQHIEAEIQKLRKRGQKLIDDIDEEGLFQIVPPDYFGSEMLQYCITVVDRRLATTAQEAFLLLEQELQRQEQMAQQQYYYDSQAAQMERLTNAVHVNTMINMLNNESRHY